MLAVFGCAKLLAEVFEKLKQPALVGEMVRASSFWPSILGRVHPNPDMSALADLGVVFLLFRVGPAQVLASKGLLNQRASQTIWLPRSLTTSWDWTSARS